MNYQTLAKEIKKNQVEKTDKVAELSDDMYQRNNMLLDKKDN